MEMAPWGMMLMGVMLLLGLALGASSASWMDVYSTPTKGQLIVEGGGFLLAIFLFGSGLFWLVLRAIYS